MLSTLSTRVALLGVCGLLVAGCQCKNEYTWDLEEPPEILSNDHGQWLSMDVSPTGDIVATYYDRTRGGVGFAIGEVRPDGQVWWQHEQVDGYPDENGMNPGDRGQFSSMAVAPDGRVWVAYYDKANGALRAAVRSGGVWESDVADIGGGLNPDAGQWASLALDTDGNPVVAHYDAEKANLRVARHDGEAWAGGVVAEGTSWSGTDAEGNPISRPADVGSFARLMIHDNTEYIAYYDAAHQALTLLEGFAGTYSETVVHDQGNVGQWPSMWTDGDELLIAFHDVGEQDLMLARRTGGGSFTVETVDDGEFAGADTEVFKKDGQVCITYFDGHNNDMRLACETGSGWNLETVGGEDVAVGYHNEVVHTHDTWWVASYNFTDRTIFVRPL